MRGITPYTAEKRTSEHAQQLEKTREAFGFMVNIAGGANGGPASYLARKEFGSNRFHVYGLEQYYNTDTFLTEALTIEAI